MFNKQFLLRFLPFTLWLPLVNRTSLKSDMIAGLTGAVIVLPQGVAFATIAGLPPEYGLYTAMVTAVIAALFGSSLHLISGPTTAISIVVFSAISRHADPGTAEYITLALTLTFLAGLYQFAFGLARLGTLVNFVSHSVVVGFTAGAAVLIVSSQLKHVLGVFVPRGESFVHIWADIYMKLGEVNYYVLLVAISTLITALVFKRFFPRTPYLLLGMITGSLVSVMVGGEDHGVRLVGKIPASLPPLSHPDLSISSFRELGSEAFAVALLGLIEAVSIARSIASKSEQRIDGNQEFMGQGLSNIVGSFFSSYAGSGSFTRSGINYSAGAKTPVSAMFSAVFLMLIILLIAPLTAYLPVAAMGGVILLVGYNLVDFHHIGKILKVSRSETSILLVTFFATLFMELEFAIYIGVMLSLIFFLNRTSTPEIVVLAPDPHSHKRKLMNVRKGALIECPQLKIIRIDMSVYFGSLDHIQSRLNIISDKEGIKHVLIFGDGINFIDLAGAEMLVHEAKRFKSLGGGLYFYGIKSKVCDFIDKGGFITAIGKENFFQSKRDALSHIYERLDRKTCEVCTARIFRECQDS